MDDFLLDYYFNAAYEGLKFRKSTPRYANRLRDMPQSAELRLPAMQHSAELRLRVMRHSTEFLKKFCRRLCAMQLNLKFNSKFSS
jgi:hypothetical protein